MDAVDYEFWKFWMSVANFIGTVVLALYIFVTSRSRVNSERINELETHIKTKIDDHDGRLARMEEHNKHVPTHEDFKRVYDKINAQSDQLNRLSGESRSQNETLKLIHQYLLSEGKR